MCNIKSVRYLLKITAKQRGRSTKVENIQLIDLSSSKTSNLCVNFLGPLYRGPRSSKQLTSEVTQYTRCPWLGPLHRGPRTPSERTSDI